MSLLLDTTVLIDILRGSKESIARLRSHAELDLATSAINVAEVHAGMRPAERASVSRLFSNLTVHPCTVEIAELAGTLKYAAARKGQTILLPDAIIAATAIKHGCQLMTANRKDFLYTGVAVFDEPAVF